MSGARGLRGVMKMIIPAVSTPGSSRDTPPLPHILRYLIMLYCAESIHFILTEKDMVSIPTTPPNITSDQPRSQLPSIILGPGKSKPLGFGFILPLFYLYSTFIVASEVR